MVKATPLPLSPPPTRPGKRDPVPIAQEALRAPEVGLDGRGTEKKKKRVLSSGKISESMNMS